MNWRRKQGSGGRWRGEDAVREQLIQPQDPDCGGSCKGAAAAGCVPRGCVAVLLVGGGDEEAEERVVVDVRALGQPCVRALLDMAAREFGYGQKGVLRIPCAADEFRRAVAADSSHRPPCRR